jgi:hypothetical protein
MEDNNILKVKNDEKWKKMLKMVKKRILIKTYKLIKFGFT